MIRVPAVCLAAAVALGPALAAAEAPAGRRFEWSTKSPEAKRLLTELQSRIESFQFGPANVELARKLVAADPGWAMGAYYLSAVLPDPAEGEKAYQKSRELARSATDGERRFIEAMMHTRLNQGVDFAKSIQPLEALAQDYPGERLVQVILGQLYNADARADRALVAFQKAKDLGPSPRVNAFLANDDLLKGQYGKARAVFQDVEKSLPKGSVPFAVRFGITFSHLYEGNTDAALKSLETYLGEYRAGGLDQQFPEVFIHNAMARINLEGGRFEEALRAYEKGYESVPGSKLPEDQKQAWLGRLHHGKARTLARMGRHEEAATLTETIKKMIVDGGEAGRQYWQAYHYLVGYTKLEAGQYQAALEHLLQADPKDPFQTLLLARAYEKLGRTDEAKKAYQKVVDSQWAGIERPLAFAEAKKKVSTL
ncbi:MAG TPA: tetratricopeptide repeat protein [Vicinamibacteria bacterium]|nr:tetratricopeptide repeat protein [Vicinamibacteria bacterium]